MLARVPELNARWESVLGRPLGLGIGLNTGTAQVGNIGSRYKFKYGPLGNAVNLASRVQGATKYLKCRLLVTEATHQQLGAEFATRRLCTVRVVNIEEPVRLYEVTPSGEPGWAEIRHTYESALAAFEAQGFRRAARLLAGLMAEAIHDGPALVLMSRAVSALAEGPTPGHPVWELPGK